MGGKARRGAANEPMFLKTPKTGVREGLAPRLGSLGFGAAPRSEDLGRPQRS